MSTPQAIVTPQAPAAIGPYSQAVSLGNDSGSLVFVSGQIPLDPEDGEIVSDDIAKQADRCLTSIAHILSEAGLRMENIVKTTVLLADINDFAAVNEVYARHITGPVMPARAAFAVAALPKGVGVEIEAIAVRP
ncbi:Rid family detoxifying hydrolase [Actinomyces vulturis]|uniref:Rid family detoxifying hydrolase n=1 Tax=Actinomyces vulturis TaxID=1857645 RepID=UPI000830E396|nr:Rid family detoxifying hydrolase [Actinomyces vulturis]